MDDGDDRPADDDHRACDDDDGGGSGGGAASADRLHQWATLMLAAGASVTALATRPR